MAGAHPPRRPCPICGRTVAVSRSTERTQPHRHPQTRARCSGSAMVVPLYDDSAPKEGA
jgi:hypothetical protein